MCHIRELFESSPCYSFVIVCFGFCFWFCSFQGAFLGITAILETGSITAAKNKVSIIALRILRTLITIILTQITWKQIQLACDWVPLVRTGWTVFPPVMLINFTLVPLLFDVVAAAVPSTCSLSLSLSVCVCVCVMYV